MSPPNTHLQHLDQLMGELGEALADRDWKRLSALNAQVRPAVDAAMAALSSGALAVDDVRTRLAELQQFVDEANRQASAARKQAADELRGLNRNRSAAQAYRNVSANRSR